MARGRAKASATLRKPAVEYTPYALHEWPERELRQEFTRLRDIAVKRLKRMGADAQASQTREFQYYSKRVPKLRELIDRLEIEDALADLAVFIRNPEISTVGGIKERQARQKAAFDASMGSDYVGGGVDVITLADWLAYAKSEGLLELFPSDDVVEFYYETGGDRQLLNQESFERWVSGNEYWREKVYEDGPEPGSDSAGF